MFLPAIDKGWFWNGSHFIFSQERKKLDVEKGESDEHRTTVEITKAMSSMIDFLNFTGEDGSMFPDGRLPTLDTAIWLENGTVKYSYYEKPTVGNQVLRRDTALPTASIRSSLLQEAVRRLINTSADVGRDETDKILSRFAQK